MQSPIIEPLRRRWLQFRLRTLLIVVAVLAVPCAWVSYSLEWIRQRHRALDAGSLHFGAYGNPIPSAPGWLWLFGKPGFAHLLFHERTTPEERERLKRLFPEADIRFDLGDELLPIISGNPEPVNGRSGK